MFLHLKVHRKYTACRLIGGNGNGGPVVSRDLSAQEKPEASAFRGARILVAHPVEFLKYLILLFFGYAHTFIFHGEVPPVFCAFQLYLNHRCFGGVFHRVLHEIGDQQLQQHGIAMKDTIRGDIGTELPPLEPVRKFFHGMREQFGERHLFPAEAIAASLQLRRYKNVIGQSVQPFVFLKRVLEQLLLFLFIQPVLDHRFQVQPGNCDRRFQLMRNGHHKMLLLLLEPDLAPHGPVHEPGAEDDDAQKRNPFADVFGPAAPFE